MNRDMEDVERRFRERTNNGEIYEVTMEDLESHGERGNVYGDFVESYGEKKL